MKPTAGDLGYLRDVRKRLEQQIRPPYFTETVALLNIAEAAREVAKASHVQKTDAERMTDAWDALDAALDRFA